MWGEPPWMMSIEGSVRNIVVSWVVTLPIAAILSVFFFYFFQGVLGT